jgi:methylenetetrahydrofolate reductase (NADPH)
LPVPPHETPFPRPQDAADSRVPFSFELYPPRTPAAEGDLLRTIDALAAAGPEFISVTFGAGGTSRVSSLNILRYIRDSTPARPLAHLTCVGLTLPEANRLVREFLDAGITSFLALRGDIPEDSTEAEAFAGGIHTAAELVQLIHRVQVERIPYVEAAVPGVPGARRVTMQRRRVSVAVAAFPNGHPNSRSTSQDIDTLLAKEAAGASLAITQLFFHAGDYFRFVERARAGGVTIPILPGIMPVTSPGRLRRILQLTGEELPADLGVALDVEPTDEGRRRIGVDYAVGLANDLIAGGVPGLHLYALNRSDSVLDVLDGCGLLRGRRGTDAGDSPDPPGRVRSATPRSIPASTQNLTGSLRS